MVDGQCVMKVTSSLENPAVFELDRKFSGGKLEIVVKSEQTGAIFTLYALNTEDTSYDEMENASYSMSVSDMNFNLYIIYKKLLIYLFINLFIYLFTFNLININQYKYNI